MTSGDSNDTQVVGRYRNRELTASDIEFLRQQCANASGTRIALARAVCEPWNWRQANGAASEYACSDLLLRLEERGLVKLPARARAELTTQRRWQMSTLPLPPDLIALTGLDVRDPDADLRQLQVRPIARRSERGGACTWGGAITLATGMGRCAGWVPTTCAAASSSALSRRTTTAKPSSTERGTAARRNSTSANPRRKQRAKRRHRHVVDEDVQAGGVAACRGRGWRPATPPCPGRAQIAPATHCLTSPNTAQIRSQAGGVYHASTVAGRPGARAPGRQPYRPPIRAEGAVPQRAQPPRIFLREACEVPPLGLGVRPAMMWSAWPTHCSRRIRSGAILSPAAARSMSASVHAAIAATAWTPWRWSVRSNAGPIPRYAAGPWRLPWRSAAWQERS